MRPSYTGAFGAFWRGPLAASADARSTRAWRRFVALLAVILMAVVVAPDLASADSEARAEAEFVQRINAERMRRSLRPLEFRSDLRDVARNQSLRMARKQRVFHNPKLGAEVCCWQKLGENVGYAATIRRLHQLFMRSSTHRANILARSFSEIGVGVERRGDVVWVSQVFRLPR